MTKYSAETNKLGCELGVRVDGNAGEVYLVFTLIVSR